MKRSIIPLMLLLLISQVYGAEITQEDPYGFDRIPIDSNAPLHQSIINQELIKSKLNELPTIDTFKSFKGEINDRFNLFEQNFIPIVLVICFAITLLQTLFFLMLRGFGKW